MKTWDSYKDKTYTQQEARKMDCELDIIHDLITEIYNDDNWTSKIKKTLDKIDRVKEIPDLKDEKI